MFKLQNYGIMTHERLQAFAEQTKSTIITILYTFHHGLECIMRMYRGI